MTTTQLSPAQHAVLAHAIENSAGKIVWFPDNIKGGARKKVLDGLVSRGLVVAIQSDWFVSTDGYDALGLKQPEPPVEPAGTTGASQVLADEVGTQNPTDTEIAASNAVDPEIEAAVAAVEAAAHAEVKTLRTRDSTKQAQVIAMLKRPEGATIAQICETTGWQQHTVRGTFAGAFKKKLGLAITSSKDAGAQRVYRIADSGAAE